MLIGPDGSESPLSVREVDLLRILTSRPGVLMDRDTLFSRIWGYDYGGTTRTLDQHILVLRKKLGDDGSCIVTVRGAGYLYQNP